MNQRPNNFMLKALMAHPAVRNNPMAQQMMNVIITDDNVTGQQIANNICKSYGMSREQMVQQAMNFFGGRR